ncbi:MAG TPA: response regulator [Polyangiaceae bacterium]
MPSDNSDEGLLTKADGVQAVVSRPLDGVRVLLIDDSPDMRELFATILTDAGAEVRAAGDGKEAMRTVIQWPPSVVVSDLVLPGTNGITLLYELRSMQHVRQIPAIAVSGRASDSDRAAAFAAGFQEHVGKPLEPDQLVALVKRWAAMAR